jgi:hypothetical protein
MTSPAKLREIARLLDYPRATLGNPQAEFVRLVARMEHSGDDGFTWIDKDPDDDRATLDGLIAQARDLLGNAPQPAKPT